MVGLSWETTLSKDFCLPSEKGSTLKGNNLPPRGVNYLPFRVVKCIQGLMSEGYHMWFMIRNGATL